MHWVCFVRAVSLHPPSVVAASCPALISTPLPVSGGAPLPLRDRAGALYSPSVDFVTPYPPTPYPPTPYTSHMCRCVVALCVGWLLEDNWRVMVGAACVPAGVLAVGLLWLPESPLWLLSRGKEEEAKAAMASLGWPQAACGVRTRAHIYTHARLSRHGHAHAHIFTHVVVYHGPLMPSTCCSTVSSIVPSECPVMVLSHFYVCGFRARYLLLLQGQDGSTSQSTQGGSAGTTAVVPTRHVRSLVALPLGVQSRDF